jgi:DNA-binding transcriptional ArsR family regulator
MNDCMFVKPWQDGAVNEPDQDASGSVPTDGGRRKPSNGAMSAPPSGDVPAIRTVSDVETLKALADPTRLAILNELMMPRADGLPVMSVKELAADLGEPQTKLYRHIKHLEAAGLIKAVTSRVVSGIVEHRYQACQSDLMLGADLTARQKASAEAEATVAAALDFYRSQFFAANRAEIEADQASPREPHRRAMLNMSTARVSASQALAIHEQLGRISDEVSQAGEDSDNAGDDLVTINVLIGYFTPDSHRE